MGSRQSDPSQIENRYATHLFKAFQWFPITIKIKIKIPTITYELFCDMAPLDHLGNFLSPTNFLFNHSISASSPTLQFLNCTYCFLCLKCYSQNIHLAYSNSFSSNCTPLLCPFASIIAEFYYLKPSAMSFPDFRIQVNLLGSPYKRLCSLTLT